MLNIVEKIASLLSDGGGTLIWFVDFLIAKERALFFTAISVKKIKRSAQPLPRSAEYDELIKALIIKGREESFRRYHREASKEEIRDDMTRYLCGRTRFAHEHPWRSCRFFESDKGSVASDGFEHVNALGINGDSTVELLTGIEAGILFRCVERFSCSRRLYC